MPTPYPETGRRDDNDDLSVLNEHNPDISGTSRSPGSPGDADAPSAIEEEQIRLGDKPGSGKESESDDDLEDAD